MRRSPFYAYPSYPIRTPQSSFYPNDAYSPLFSRQQHLYPPSSSSSPQTPSRPVINIPVLDSTSPTPPPPSRTQIKSPAAPRFDPVSAATLIQAYFRGFSIRRHRPLIHLRTISGARRQLEELKAELERPGFSLKVRSNEKERLRFSESVMAVILRLDAIEGSIPEVRSQRKDATKFAISLQDTMDLITSQEDESFSSKTVDTVLPDVACQDEGNRFPVSDALQVANEVRDEESEEQNVKTAEKDLSHNQEQCLPTSMQDRRLLAEDVDEVQVVMPAGEEVCPPTSLQEDGHQLQEVTPMVGESLNQEGCGTMDVTSLQEEQRGRDVESLLKNYAMERPFSHQKEDNKHESEEHCIMQHQYVETSYGVDNPREDSHHQNCNSSQAGELCTAKDEMMNEEGPDQSCRYAISDSTRDVDAAKFQVAHSGSTCACDGYGITSHTNETQQKQQEDIMSALEDEDVANAVDYESLNDISSDNAAGNGYVCCDDVTGLKNDVNFRYADSFAEHQSEHQSGVGKLVSTDVCSESVEDDDDKPVSEIVEHVLSKSDEESNLLCGASSQHLDHMITTACAVPADRGLSSSDNLVLKQLSEQCGQLKTLLGKLLVQSRVQSKVISALGERLEMLEQQQQRSGQNNPRKQKRKLKKGTARSVKCRQL